MDRPLRWRGPFLFKSRRTTSGHVGCSPPNIFYLVNNNSFLFFLFLSLQIDHFGFLENGTFKQRYLLNDQHWHKEGDPILFYTGNEGDIAWFCNNTVNIPLLLEMALKYDALIKMQMWVLVQYLENRYRTVSLPFRINQFYTSVKCISQNRSWISWNLCFIKGFMWDVAEELGAMLVFAEHRYYGESMPFGEESYSVSPEHCSRNDTC